MKIYNYRNNFTAQISDGNQIIRGKLAFKTKELNWLNTDAPVIALISVHSSIHDGIDGDLKMQAFISTIKNQTKGKITILIAEKAHIHTLCLKYQNDFHKAFQESLKNAHEIVGRYNSYFESCYFTFWDTYISNHIDFNDLINQLKLLSIKDSLFHNYLQQDAEMSYTRQRAKEFPNKELFIEKAIEDLLEQCACLLILSKKGYRFQFYPGSSCLSTEYINNLFLTPEQRINWINVFLTIEKKTYFNVESIT